MRAGRGLPLVVWLSEWPHLVKISEPAILRAELDLLQVHWNTVRLHAGIGYVTPDDEHTGRAETPD